MSEGHIQLTSQLEKSHKKLGVVLIWRVGTLRTASGRRSVTNASVAARRTNQKPVQPSHVGKSRADGTCDRQAARWEDKSWHYGEKGGSSVRKEVKFTKVGGRCAQTDFTEWGHTKTQSETESAKGKFVFTHAWHLSRASWILHRDRHPPLLRRRALQKTKNPMEARSWTCHLSGGVKIKPQSCLSVWNPLYQKGRRKEAAFPRADVRGASFRRGQNAHPREDSISPTQRRRSSETKKWTTGVTQPTHPLRVSMEAFLFLCFFSYCTHIFCSTFILVLEICLKHLLRSNCIILNYAYRLSSFSSLLHFYQL